MTYQKARLWLGISGVGTLVLFASIAVIFGLPQAWTSGKGDAEVIATVMAIYVALSAPFDWVGGLILPRRFGRASSSASHFAMRWLRGAVFHAAVMAISFSLILAAGKAGGLLAATAAVFTSMLVLVATQSLLARSIGGLKRTKGAPSVREFLDKNVKDEGRAKTGRETAISVYQSADPGFTGGITGIPGAEQIIVPASWQTHLDPKMQETLIMRRQAILNSPTRTFGLFMAMVWNLVGFLLAASLLPGADVATASGLVTIALGAGLWNFLGLLLLPTPSRNAVLAIDQQICKQSDSSKMALLGAVNAIHELQDDEPRRGRWIETVFHPIPALENRLRLLTVTQPEQIHRGGPRPWHLARMTLYLSWACFGFLSRAVHCNSGRPDLWVMLPCD